MRLRPTGSALFGQELQNIIESLHDFTAEDILKLGSSCFCRICFQETLEGDNAYEVQRALIRLNALVCVAIVLARLADVIGHAGT